MTPEQFQEVKRVFLEASARSPETRARFLDEACAAAPSLRGEIEAMLAAHDRGESFMDTPAAVAIAQAEPQGIPRPERIDGFRILDVLGEGGMGIVYLAEQDRPKRIVALKVVRPGLASAGILRRFEHESQMLARLQHPGIAQIFAAGTHEAGFGPQPYFAMERVEGIPITEYATKNDLDIRARLKLLVKVCDAVQHAHQKGIVHRDLKPDNILVDTAGQPKIVDFGIARLVDADVRLTTVHTEIGQLLGTIPYMSPEQIAADPDEIDTRTDIYALGVIGYELLTRQWPYPVRDKSPIEAGRIIRDEEPPRLSSIDKTLRGDLETIIAKALAKDKRRRYASAAELAADIERFLNDEPILARPPSSIYQLRKFARRNRALAAGIAIAFVGSLLAAVVSTIALSRAITDREKAREAGRLAEGRLGDAEAARDETRAVTDFLTEMLASVDPAARGRSVAVYEVLDVAAARIGEKFSNKPLIEASLRRTIGRTYLGLGLIETAQNHLRDAAVIYTRELGPRDPRTLSAAIDHAAAIADLGRYAQAEAQQRSTLEIQHRILGEEHSDTLATMTNLANTVYNQGRYAEAEALRRQTLVIQRRVLGDEHPHTLASMNNLAISLDELGRYAEAAALRRQTLDIQRRILGEEHPQTLVSMNNLAVSLDYLGRYAEAEELFRKTLEIRRRLLGDEHQSTLLSVHGLASILSGQMRFAEAEELDRKTMMIRRRVMGPKHQHTLLSMNNLANNVCDQGRYAEAEDLYRQTLEIQRQVLGEEHPSTLQSMHNLANALATQGRFAEAKNLFQRTLEARRRILGEDHPYTLNSMIALAEVLHRIGDASGSELLYRDAIQRRRRRAENEPASAADLDAYAFLLSACEVETLRDPAAALPAALQAVTMTGRRSVEMLNTLAAAYHRTGQGEQAVKTQREALVLVPAAPSPLRAEMESRLGEYLAADHQYAEAEPLLVNSYHYMADTIHAARHTLKEFADRLVALYESWGKPEEASKYRALLGAPVESDSASEFPDDRTASPPPHQGLDE